MIEVKTIPLGAFQVNCFILKDTEMMEFIVIDTPAISPVFDKLLKSGFRAKAILLTHGHIDHIAALAPLKQKLNCPVRMHEKDRGFLNHVAGNPYQEILHAHIPPEPDEWLADRDTIKLNETPIHILHTPGHTPGSVSFHIPGTGVFTGDALFRESIGRTDLPGGDTGLLLSSIREKLLSLPDDTRVFPGHGPESTIGHEKKFNPFIQIS
ncbi:MAG: MBL fold metallo-hydrolase [Acidobacteria bacterium]|nr:MBL fold metallo-hydrolase [Acidobacteriota bacterium]